MIPKQLKQLKFCRIKKGNKAPFEKDWPNKPYSYEKITLTFPMENYGVLCGYENLAVIDCDNPQLVTMVRGMLPETFSVRTGGGGTHFYYFIPELKKKIILNLDGVHLGEVQSHGTQVVGAGSIHPNGKEYEVLDNVGIKELSLEELKKVIGIYMEKEIMSDDVGKETGELTKEIISSVDFEKLLVGYGLEKKGENWNCPFHKSIGGQCLGVDEKKGIFNCFHCGWKGNIISFVSKVEDITIYEAINKLKPKKEEAKNLFSRRGQLQSFYDVQPFYYDKANMFWFWDNEIKKWVLSDEVDFLVSIQREIGINTLDSKTRTELISGFKQIGRENKPEVCPKNWIQFKNKIYDINTGESFEASSKYFITNPIPWEVGESSETPTIDGLFMEWVGEKNKEELYEFISYCSSLDQFMQRIFAFVGGGSNGKGTFIKLCLKFLGKENCVSSELKNISEDKFEPAVLYRKLLCVMGEVSHDDLKNTNQLKKLSGEDLISFQFKGKTPFTDENTATCVCLTNSLPITPDKSLGFYRKWDIKDFPNQFNVVVKNLIEDIPEIEFSNLARRVLDTLKELYKIQKFTNEGNFQDRMKKYEERSNPVMKFIEENCVEEEGFMVGLREFTNECNKYMKVNHLRILTSKQVGKILREEGFIVGNRKVEDISAVVILNVKIIKTMEEL